MTERKELEIDELEELLDEKSESKTKINFSTIYTMVVLNWQYFLLSLIIFVCGALLYLRYTEPTYKMSARLLINEEDKHNSGMSQMLQGMMDMGFMSNSSGIDNEVEVLQSRVLVREVVRDLNLYSEYRLKGRVKDVIVYGRQPVTVELDPYHLDSLDRDFVELGFVSSVRMRITRQEGAYYVEGVVLHAGETKTQETFAESITTLPAHLTTSLGTLTLTESSRFAMKEKDVYLVTVLPPMVVASNYLGNMTVESTSKRTDIARVTLIDKNKQRGMAFLRHLAVCYNRQSNADKNEIAVRTEQFINERISKINEELGSTEKGMEQYKRQHAVTGMSVDAMQAVQMSNQYSGRLAEVNSQIQMLDYLRDYIVAPGNKYQIIPSNVGLTDGVSTQLIDSYNKAVLDRNRLLTSASERAPQVQTLTETIESLLTSINEALLQARRSADIVRQGLVNELNKYHGQVTGMPEQERVLTQIGRQMEVKSGVYLLLLQKREENSIALAATADRGKLIDEPLLMGKVGPKNLLVMLVALLLAVGIPFGVIVMVRLLRYRIEGHNDVEQLTNLAIIGDVPVASEAAKTTAGIVVHENENTQMDEVFRSLRANVQFMLMEGQKVVLFTSGLSGEGKTFCAANLATSFALLGKRVVLCGLDIRKPALGRLFGVNDKRCGITPLLNKEHVEWQDVEAQIVNTGVSDNFDMLMAGPVPPNPTELLSRDGFRQVMELLQEKYDYVILDTAPIGLVTDTLYIAKYAHVSVCVCRADYTPKSAMGQFNQMAAEGRLPNACLVINGIDMSRRKYGYYYGYGAYGRYGRYGYGKYGTYGQYGNYSESHYSQKDDKSIKR
ncbi:MAG: polysaccharide biosynthesis tyrosine autokinase [Bacteroidales bacterium]|nr:polysaccharide biosynthesis tyrosine autokinase [Bacteroidales bacterium]